MFFPVNHHYVHFWLRVFILGLYTWFTVNNWALAQALRSSGAWYWCGSLWVLCVMYSVLYLECLSQLAVVLFYIQSRSNVRAAKFNHCCPGDPFVGLQHILHCLLIHETHTNTQECNNTHLFITLFLMSVLIDLHFTLLLYNSAPNIS